jgi:multidrug efflux system outer membrane protein
MTERTSQKRTLGPGALPTLLFSVAAFGCTVGPNYERPKVESPAEFRGAAIDPAAPGDQAAAAKGETPAPGTANGAQGPSLAERRWAEIFTDASLRQLIETALRDGYDYRLAAARVLESEAQYGVIKSASFPVVSANASAAAQRGRLGGTGPAATGGLYTLGASVSWEVDFWGAFRRANEAGRAQMLGSEWGRRAVMTTLVSQIATLYFQLRSFDRELDIAKRTLASRQESLRLTQVREQGGAGSLVDVKQAEQLVHGANAQIVDLQRLIEQQENLISGLLGRGPGPIPRGQEVTAQEHVSDVPTGLPSALLERRPDIQQAEQRLVAANAQIGVAKAAYFPNITLTASGGVASAALSTLFSAPAIIWSAAASAVQPIFNGGRISSEVQLAEVQRDEAVLSYRQTILLAFREVSDALVGYQRGREFRAIQEDLVNSAKEARRLSDLRYQGGTSSYLEVLDSDSRLFTAELGLVQAELSELSAFVEIYRALGGGWQA